MPTAADTALAHDLALVGRDSSSSAVPVAQTFGLSKVYGVGAAAVAALDDVTVEFERGRLTAIMGPSGSGKSTLMHCMAALDAPSAGRVVIDGVDISHLKDKALTRLRRDRLGFVFQAYNLVPTLTARENITLPMDIAGRKVDAIWFDVVVDTLGIRDRLSHRPDELLRWTTAAGRVRTGLAAAGRRSSSPTSRRATSTPTPVRRSWPSCGASVDDFGQTILMVTHDPSAATYADRVVFLADGRIVDDLHHPTLDGVLDRIQRLRSARAGGLRCSGSPSGDCARTWFACS